MWPFFLISNWLMQYHVTFPCLWLANAVPCNLFVFDWLMQYHVTLPCCWLANAVPCDFSCRCGCGLCADYPQVEHAGDGGAAAESALGDDTPCVVQRAHPAEHPPADPAPHAPAVGGAARNAARDSRGIARCQRTAAGATWHRYA